jgi:hypothetical protein
MIPLCLLEKFGAMGCENTDPQIVGFTTNGRGAIARPSTSTMTAPTISAAAIATIAAE